MVISVSVCLCVHSHISKTIRPNFTRFSLHALLWRQCDTLCASGFVEDMCSYNGGIKPNQRRRISSISPGVGTGAKSTISDCILFLEWVLFGSWFGIAGGRMPRFTDRGLVL